MRDDDTDPVAQQPFGGPLHEAFGDRVHPGGRLVEDHHVRVADQDSGERHQLFLAGGEYVPTVAQLRLQPAGQLRHPTGQAEFVECPAGRGDQFGVEERDVLGEGTGKDLGTLRHDRDVPAQRLQVQFDQVGTAEEDGTGGQLDRPGEYLAEGGLAGAGTPDDRVRASPDERQVDVDKRRLPLVAAIGRAWVPEGQPADVELPVDRLGAADRLLRRTAQQLYPRPRAERVLQVGQHPAEALDGEAERDRQQPDGGQPGGVESTGRQCPATTDDDDRDGQPHHTGGHRGDASRQLPLPPAAGQYLAGALSQLLHHVRPGQAGTHVVLAVDGLLHHRRQIRPGLLLGNPDRPDAPGRPGQPDGQRRCDHQHHQRRRPPHERRGQQRQGATGQALRHAYAVAA